MDAAASVLNVSLIWYDTTW